MGASITHEQALIYVMVTIAAVDRKMDDTELLRIGDMVRVLPVFRSYNPDNLVQDAAACGEMLQKEDGLATVLTLVAEVLPLILYETAYALAVEVAAADMHVEQEELRFLQMLRDRLDLDKLMVASIEYAARVRHRIP